MIVFATACGMGVPPPPAANVLYGAYVAPVAPVVPVPPVPVDDETGVGVPGTGVSFLEGVAVTDAPKPLTPD